MKHWFQIMPKSSLLCNTASLKAFFINCPLHVKRFWLIHSCHSTLHCIKEDPIEDTGCKKAETMNEREQRETEINDRELDLRRNAVFPVNPPVPQLLIEKTLPNNSREHVRCFHACAHILGRHSII